MEQEILRSREPFADVLRLLRSVLGLCSDPITVIAVLSEIGGDMSVFPTAKNLCSWAGCCPRNDKSGGKVKSTRISRAGAYIKPLLVQIANALIKSHKHPEFGERYRRIKARRGHKKAVIAVCRMILVAVWNILSKLEPYSPYGYATVRPAEPSKVLTTAQALDFLRLRGYVIKDRDDFVLQS